jgi:hypothetical protein
MRWKRLRHYSPNRLAKIQIEPAALEANLIGSAVNDADANATAGSATENPRSPIPGTNDVPATI